MWQPKAGLAYRYSVSYTYNRYYTKQNQQLETKSKPEDNELKGCGIK